MSVELFSALDHVVNANFRDSALGKKGAIVSGASVYSLLQKRDFLQICDYLGDGLRVPPGPLVFGIEGREKLPRRFEELGRDAVLQVQAQGWRGC